MKTQLGLLIIGAFISLGTMPAVGESPPQGKNKSGHAARRPASTTPQTGMGTVIKTAAKLVDKWDPEQPVFPTDINEHVRALLDEFRKMRKEIESDRFSLEDREFLKDMISRFETKLLEDTEKGRREHVKVAILNICVGVEWDSSRLTNKIPLGPLKPITNWVSSGGVLMPCVRILFSGNIATGVPNGFPSVGYGLLAGPRFEMAEYVNGTRRYARPEFVWGGSIMWPIKEQQGPMKMKDFMGIYAGGGLDVAMEGVSAADGLSRTFNGSGLLKADYELANPLKQNWPPEFQMPIKIDPKVAMGQFLVTRSGQKTWAIPKGQVLYYEDGQKVLKYLVGDQKEHKEKEALDEGLMNMLKLMKARAKEQ